MKTLVRATTRIESRGATSEQTRYFISSAPLDTAAGRPGRQEPLGHREPALGARRCVPGGPSRLRRGNGARNIALVRRFAFNIVRAGGGKTSIKTARKAAEWDPSFLASLLSHSR